MHRAMQQSEPMHFRARLLINHFIAFVYHIKNFFGHINHITVAASRQSAANFSLFFDSLSRRAAKSVSFLVSSDKSSRTVPKNLRPADVETDSLESPHRDAANRADDSPVSSGTDYRADRNRIFQTRRATG